MAAMRNTWSMVTMADSQPILSSPFLFLSSMVLLRPHKDQDLFKVSRDPRLWFDPLTSLSPFLPREVALFSDSFLMQKLIAGGRLAELSTAMQFFIRWIFIQYLL